MGKLETKIIIVRKTHTKYVHLLKLTAGVPLAIFTFKNI
jgi:hypothetical protein